jgi:hypothetical protein
LGEGGLEDLEDWCRSTPDRRLIVVDTFQKLRPPQAAKGQASYALDYEAIVPLQQLAHKYSIAILLIHHLRKMDADDPFDTISGTLGLTGAADSILVLRKQHGSVTLHAHGRDIEESETALQFDKATCKWTILGAAEDIHRSDERARIVAALKDAPSDGMSVPEIMVAAEMPNRNAADLLLFKMRSDGEVRRLRRGVYALPEKDGKEGKKD